MDKQAMKQHGAFSWNELMTNDLAGAKAFYGELFGWNMHDDDSTGMPYTMLKIGDRGCRRYDGDTAGSQRCPRRMGVVCNS